MLIKIGIPKDAKILKSSENELILEMPKFYVEYQTAIDVFSVSGNDLIDFNNHDTIDCLEVLVKQNGKFDIETYDGFEEEDED